MRAYLLIVLVVLAVVQIETTFGWEAKRKPRQVARTQEAPAVIYNLEGSNNLVTVVVDDRPTSRDGRHEQCPHIKGQGNNNLVLRVVVNGYSCPLWSDNHGSHSGGSGNLIPDISVTYCSSSEVFISAGGSIASQNSTAEEHPLETFQSGLIGPVQLKLSDGGCCPSIDIAMSTDINIRIVVDNSKKWPPFKGINLSHTKGYRANLMINSRPDCGVPRINLVHCEHTNVQIHTKLSSSD